MEYFKNFDVKKMLFRIVTVGYTFFFANFFKDYFGSFDVVHALHVGFDSMLQGLCAGFGLDQLIYHNSKQ